MNKRVQNIYSKHLYLIENFRYFILLHTSIKTRMTTIITIIQHRLKVSEKTVKTNKQKKDKENREKKFKSYDRNIFMECPR